MELISSIKTIFSLICGLIGIATLITFHELGHFIFCKIFDIKTPSFSIGFGPRILSKKMGETEFKISAIPLGGYVEIAGAAEVGQGEQLSAKDRDKRSFATKPYYQKLLVMVGGILFNIIFAYVALVLVLAFGSPKTPLLYPYNATNIVNSIDVGSPAEQAGLKPGDAITKINETIFSEHDAGNMLFHLMDKPNTLVTFTVLRNNHEKIIPVKLAEQLILGKTAARHGINFTIEHLKPKSLSVALVDSFYLTHKIIKNTMRAFLSIFSKSNIKSLSGPIMIIKQTAQSALEGFSIFLLLLALISVNLAVLNLIPLPILDGGQILFYTIEAVLRRPLHERIREVIHIITWIGLLLLAAYLAIQDTSQILQTTNNQFLIKICKMIGLRN